MFRISDRVSVPRDGRLVWNGPTAATDPEEHLELPGPFRTPTPCPAHLLLGCAAQRDPADD
ncbi:hypothetical protein [Streptomyces anandii]|uniref:hypothetical protein n=1 Tax=Streptomyces anandii TaxID=285454 RepID=UPI0016754766|nr:hypothetical protein [Streptomyces anandii]GGY12040.1 hypothetical protein GCM10010510_67590 [Streptomyces anandii JCM 4720]